MKKIIIYSAPVAISLIWLILTDNTLNPIALKGPDFLRFYSILLLGFYTSMLVLKIRGESFSEITFYGMICIFVLGVIKLIRGIFLGKPIGFLLLILIMESVVFLFINSNYRNRKMR